MKDQEIINDCSRGCKTWKDQDEEIKVRYSKGCCKLSVFDWLQGITDEQAKDLYEVRFKNTRKSYYKNTSGQQIEVGDFVTVEATNGHDVGIVTLSGPVILAQLRRNNIESGKFEFKKIYRKAKGLDIERWQETISREHKTMIRSRQIAASLGLSMKIGDVEFQGDGTKAIFYYIADERVDFRQLIRLFADEFKIRIEMRQIGARQEAGLIGGIGVCGQELCCARFMSDFQSITTQAARCQDLSLNPQKLAGQCSKLKCCINYEAAVYIDAHSTMPVVKAPLDTDEGPAFLVKTDVLKGLMWFSYEQNSMAGMFPITFECVKEILKQNRRGVKVPDLRPDKEAAPEFKSAVGEGSISRFDEEKRGNRNNHKKKKKQSPKKGNEN
ncbi:MAG: regulatory iron-sulfur-containing complex subunit RicT [Bacteroidales bacterium]|nr:regulatory iron-sulfur-containing complex subunit RicT [Bacteroidales bacterium]